MASEDMTARVQRGPTHACHLLWTVLGQKKDAGVHCWMRRTHFLSLPDTREAETIPVHKERSSQASQHNALPRAAFLLLPRAELKILVLS